MIKLEHLQMHAANGCNFTCESCSHFSNQGHTGIISPENADAQMSLWSKRLDPNVFSVLGGEPLLNNQIEKFLEVTRSHWKNEIHLVTNGFLLHRFPDLPKTLEAFDITLFITRHHNDSAYNTEFFRMFQLVKEWSKSFKFKLGMADSFNNWTRRHHGFASGALPYEDQNARGSWEVCPAKMSRQLFENNIYKCSPITYLQLQKRRWNISEKWDQYLDYQPLNPSCSDEELKRFLGQEEESICTMCTSKPEYFEKPSPLSSFNSVLRKHMEKS